MLKNVLPRLSGSGFNVPGWKNLKQPRLNVMLVSSWFQNRSTQYVTAGIPDFDQYFKQFQSVVTLEL
jgi:hypothetical protein